MATARRFPAAHEPQAVRLRTYTAMLEALDALGADDPLDLACAACATGAEPGRAVAALCKALALPDAVRRAALATATGKSPRSAGRAAAEQAAKMAGATPATW